MNQPYLLYMNTIQYTTVTPAYLTAVPPIVCSSEMYNLCCSLTPLASIFRYTPVQSFLLISLIFSSFRDSLLLSFKSFLKLRRRNNYYFSNLFQLLFDDCHSYQQATNSDAKNYGGDRKRLSIFIRWSIQK